jgi:hypothetical protein
VIERSLENYGIKSNRVSNVQKSVQKAVAAQEDFPFDENRVF